MPNVFQNGSSSTREAALPKEPEPFFEKPELCMNVPRKLHPGGQLAISCTVYTGVKSVLSSPMIY